MTIESIPRRKGRLLRCASDRLCLEFVNTVAWRKTETPEERLPSPSVFLHWCLGAGIVGVGHAGQLRKRWQARPREGIAFHHRAIELREAIYQIFRSRVLSNAAPEEALRILNETLAAAPLRARIVPSGDAFDWWVEGARRAASDVLAPIAWSAADLMTHPQRVRQCEDYKGCGWLFVDESRAGTRRWCSMGECGNRAKARRHYFRRKQLEAGAALEAAGDVR